MQARVVDPSGVSVVLVTVSAMSPDPQHIRDLATEGQTMTKSTKKFNNREWVVHANRSEMGLDEPGRTGHFRAVSRPRTRPTTSKCLVRVDLPRDLSHLADADGSVTFGGDDWWFPVGAAHTFARCHTNVKMPNPFGFKHDWRWFWWDGDVTDESRVGGPDETRYVEKFFERLFPGMPITLIDKR